METEHTAPLPAAYRMRPAMSIYADGKKADERGCGIHAQTCGEYWLAAVFVAQRAPYEHGQGKQSIKPLMVRSTSARGQSKTAIMLGSAVR
ncbi:hypothetical protein AGMMS49925_10540 [Deltaproteobacteria bacterium]|nr:hypothetical protein AGMMS49925_10540 [Deltaproteobacteria bacterium]